jgi:ribosomal protein S18 acetylase RimI-like enzyme
MNTSLRLQKYLVFNELLDKIINMKSNIILERATSSDTDRFIKIEKGVEGQKTYSAITTEDEAKKELENNIVYFVKKDKNLVGSISYEIKNSNHAYISGLVVSPDFQGQGIGRQAMLAIMPELKKYERIDLVTHPDNFKAISLYTSLGFEIESRKVNYFGDGEP